MNSLGVNCTHPRMAIATCQHWFRVISPKRIFGHLGCEDLISTTVQDKMAVGCQRDIPWFAYKQGRYHSSPSKHHSNLFYLNNHRLYSRGIRFRLNSSVRALYRIDYTITGIRNIVLFAVLYDRLSGINPKVVQYILQSARLWRRFNSQATLTVSIRQ